MLRQIRVFPKGLRRNLPARILPPSPFSPAGVGDPLGIKKGGSIPCSRSFFVDQFYAHTSNSITCRGPTPPRPARNNRDATPLLPARRGRGREDAPFHALIPACHAFEARSPGDDGASFRRRLRGNWGPGPRGRTMAIHSRSACTAVFTADPGRSPAQKCWFPCRWIAVSSL